MSSSIERKRQNYQIVTLILISRTNSVSTLWTKFLKFVKSGFKSPQITRDNIKACRERHQCLHDFFYTSNNQKIIGKSASKSCLSDPVPTWLLKEHLDVLLPVITDIVSLSLESGAFPDEMKRAMVKPLLKNSSLDSNLLKNFRPISNIPIKNH